MNVLIKSAHIIDETSSHHKQQKDVLIENGVITRIANRITNPGKIKEIKRPNLHLSCGWFDTSVSFGEPGFEERETLENGLKTAAHSGFTAIALNSSTEPPIDSKASVEYLKKSSENKSFICPENVVKINFTLFRSESGKQLVASPSN